MRVDDTMFEAALARAQGGAPADPQQGLFGPDTVYWRVTREAALFLGAGRATLLQLAHPFVAQAVADHSTTKQDPFGRFHRTFSQVYAMTFGTREQALAAAGQVRRIHDHITGRLDEAAGPFPAGTSYIANDAQALMWVWSTLSETSVLVYETVVGPLGRKEREEYYAASRRFALLFGVPEQNLPEDWRAFRAWCREMQESSVITVTGAARELAYFVLHETRLGPLKGVPRWYLALTASMLPAHLRPRFGLDWNRREKARAGRAIRNLRRFYRFAPPRLRYVAPWWEARARLRGRPHPDRLTRTLNRVWIGREAL
ncbi:MAG: oxygenase MpaB family protein [bacterium]